jgi:hypothetical protein
MKKFLHISSPSKVMRDQVGKWIPAGVAQGMTDNMGTVRRASKTMVNNVIIPQQPTSSASNNLDYNLLAKAIDVALNRPLSFRLTEEKYFTLIKSIKTIKQQ